MCFQFVFSERKVDSTEISYFRFAQCFTKSSFNWDEAVEEVDAAPKLNEYREDEATDRLRILQVEKSLSKIGHAFNHFIFSGKFLNRKVVILTSVKSNM